MVHTTALIEVAGPVGMVQRRTEVRLRVHVREVISRAETEMCFKLLQQKESIRTCQMMGTYPR